MNQEETERILFANFVQLNKERTTLFVSQNNCKLKVSCCIIPWLLFCIVQNAKLGVKQAGVMYLSKIHYLQFLTIQLLAAKIFKIQNYWTREDCRVIYHQHSNMGNIL